MLNNEVLAKKLEVATLTTPFSELGLFKSTSGKGWLIKTWQPNATKVELVEFSRNRTLKEFEQASRSGLFVLDLPTRKQAFKYRLRVHYGDTSILVIDPYQYKDEAFHAVHYLQTEANNVYKQLGAQQVALNGSKKGQTITATRFAVFAPNASSCTLIGDFNHWNGAALPMEKTTCGHFVLVCPDIKTGAKYKFELKDKNGHLLPHKSDPVGFACEQYPSFASVVYDHEGYQWQDDEWLTRRASSNHFEQPMSIYEVHLGSWRKQNNSHDHHQPLNYQQLSEQLIPYVKEMGYTHIEVLPVSEHPFTGSWGYQPTGMFAPTSRFGNPDEFKAFVDQCHQAGIGIIIDWVPAHFPEDAHGLAHFDGTHLYDYEDPKKGWHPDWNSCIYDFGKDTVRQFLVASALYWCDKFHVDGLRVDAVASMLYLDYSRKANEWIPNIDGGNHNYEAISLLQWFNQEVRSQFPGVMTIAEESTSFDGVSRPVEQGGLGFHYKWNMGWMHDTLTYFSKDPLHRKHHHSDLTFAMVYHYNENFVLPISHDEVVHGKGSMINKMPGDTWQKYANYRAFAGFMYGHPGKKLNFMGAELGQNREWNHDDQLDWNGLSDDKNKGIQNLIHDLNRVYVNHSALYHWDYHSSGFSWLDHQDAEHSIVAFKRVSQTGQVCLVVGNFTPVPREKYKLGVPFNCGCEVLINTDQGRYGGSDYDLAASHYNEMSNAVFKSQSQPWQNQSHHIELNLPPLSVLIISCLQNDNKNK